MIDINIKIDGKGKGNAGMMGMSLGDILEDKPVIVKKKKKKKVKSSLMRAVESAIPKKSEYDTETV